MKFPSGHGTAQGLWVVPAEGTWVEIAHVWNEFWDAIGSSPRRGRGLKCTRMEDFFGMRPVVPAEGTWVEMDQGISIVWECEGRPRGGDVG